jgi:hypothetical protein
MNAALASGARWTLWGSIVAICLLTFVWPFTISRDPDQPAFKLAAIAVLFLFLGALLVLLAARLAAKE